MVSPHSHGRGRRKRRPQAAQPGESRAAESLTVAWMLATLSTIVGSVISLGAAAIGVLLDADASASAALLAYVLWFAALVSGLLTLILTPLVYRQRRIPPPRTITVVAIVAGLSPWAVLAAVLINA